MRALSTVSRSIFGWVSAAVAVAVIAVSASVLAAPGKAYADTASHIEATGEIHALVDGAGNASIPNVTLKNTGSAAAYVTGCSAPAELTGWTCDAVGKRIEPGQSVQASWSGQVSAETAAKLGCEAYFAGTLTYSYDDAELKATVAIDNQDPCVGDTVTASVSGLNVSDDQVTYQWYRVKNGVETAIDGAVQPAYTVVDADADCTLLCRLFSSDSICIGSVSSDATHEVKRAVEAFAVYSADDNSLNFYKRAGMPSAGEQFEGKTATAVYTGIEKDTYSTTTQPWRNYASTITTAAVIDQNIAPTSTANWFYKLSNMTSCDLGKLDTSNVISMANMFNNCKSLNTLSDISNWNTSNVTSTGYMFYNCSSLSDISDLTNWNTSSITRFYSMFYGCSNLTTLNGLSNWDTSKVTLMASMFDRCSSLTSLDLSNWDTSKVTNMGNMFEGCTNLTTLSDLSNWNTSNVTNMYDMFYNCSSLGDLNLSNWNTSKVTNMRGTFYGCSSLASLDLSGWSTSNVINMMFIFDGMTHLQQITLGSNWKWVGDYGYLPTPSRTYITGADGKWYDTDGNGYAPKDIPSNKAMTYTAIGPKTAFAVYSAGDGSLNFYKRAGMPSAGERFEGKTATAVYTGIETMTSRPWSGYASNIKTATVVDDGIRPCNMDSWFFRCNSMTACDLGKLDTSNVAIMQGTFNGCKSLMSLDISNWNTSNVTDMDAMFNGCSSLTSLDLSGWDTSKTAIMIGMFNGCSNLAFVGDLSNWNTSNITDMSYMFAGCTSLTALDLSGWNTSKVTNMSSMFSGCSKLSVDCSNWDVSKVTGHSSFNNNAPGVVLPLAWQTSSDEGVEDSAIAPLCEEQGNGDALGVSSENNNSEPGSKTDGEASADSETVGNATTSAADVGAKEEEAPDGIAQEEPIAA